jgi:hypothetical protein
MLVKSLVSIQARTPTGCSSAWWILGLGRMLRGLGTGLPLVQDLEPLQATHNYSLQQCCKRWCF